MCNVLIDEYIKKINSLEQLTKIPVISKKEVDFNSYNNKCFRKKINYTNICSFCEKTSIEVHDLLMGVFVYTLLKYSGEEQIFFSIYENSKTFPMYVECVEKKVKPFLTNIKEIYSFVKSNNKEIINETKKNLNNKSSIFVTFNQFDESNFLNNMSNFKEYNHLFAGIYIDDGYINISLHYDEQLYDEKILNNFIESYITILNSFVVKKNLNSIEYLAKSDLSILKKVNSTDFNIEDKNISTIFERIAEENKNKLAFICNGESITFEQLNMEANKVAHELIKIGVKKQEIITIILNRTIYSPIVRQGILKSGCAFLNIIPEYPDERINYILENSNSRFIITSKNIFNLKKDFFDNCNSKVLLIEELLESKDIQNLNIDVKPEDLCYCIYTSGSTGKPKGVMIEHRNLINYCNINKYNYEATVVGSGNGSSLALASLTFDVSILEEFIPLLNGKTVVMATEEEIYNPIKLSSLIEKNNVEVITCTPSFLNNIIDISEVKNAIKKIKKFNIGAEAFPQSLYGRIKNINSDAMIYNGYGPTEATIGCTFKELNSDTNITIGLPMANTKIYMLDKSGSILPVGVPGELTIVGNGVSRGYINCPDLNKEKFIKIYGQRAYRSGDLAKWNFNGEIEFLGRIDNQVKINGFRMELSEIQSIINSFGDISSSEVRVIDKECQNKYLIAYYTANKKIESEVLKEYLKSKLPCYMIPKKFIQLDSFPLNANGKIDIKKLPICDVENEENYIAPTDENQIILCDIFSELLDNRKIGITDNFFEIGGDSLKVMKLITMASQKNINIDYKDVFNYPTVAQLSDFILKNNKTDVYNNHEKKYDYDKIHELLKNNTIEGIVNISNKKIGNVAITGVTGFLGIHILWELLNNLSYSGKIYCLVRKGKFDTLNERMSNLFNYYFNEDFNQISKEKVIFIEGDITNNECFKILENYDVDVFINCAAIVKYFDAKNQIEQVNINGVKNIVDYCMKNNVELIQISTTSIGGTASINEITKPFGENVLYFGQNLDNKYSYTKFIAERIILESVLSGLKAKIMRIGNLMPRYKDSKFQINTSDNGFIGMFKSFKFLEAVPEGLLGKTVELSPVDMTAKAVLSLINTDLKYTIYHPFNNHKIYYYDIIHAMQKFGFKINKLPDNLFKELLASKIKNDNDAEKYIGLFADLTASNDEESYEIDAENVFTTEILYSLGFEWPFINNNYLTNTLIELNDINYFETKN